MSMIDKLAKYNAYREELGPTKAVLHCLGPEYSIVADWSDDPSWRIEYFVYQISGLSGNGKKALAWESCKNLYEPDLNKAHPFLHGFVVRDGCSDWMFSGSILHCCDREGLIALGEVMAFCWDWTAELCPEWNPG